jgi:hypothetical protein
MQPDKDPRHCTAVRQRHQFHPYLRLRAQERLPRDWLVFSETAAATSSGPWTAYLVGFDSFRSVNYHTSRRGDAAWERNLYRHPSRQGLLAQEVYSMQHDVYSLGVCLLELGIWDSFIRYAPLGEGDSSGTQLLPSDILELSAHDFEQASEGQQMPPSQRIKDRLVKLAQAKLPARMGDRYTAVVETCLTCLDQGNEDFGDDQEMCDEGGILVGVRFIEKISV